MKRIIVLVVMCAVFLGFQKPKTNFGGVWHLDLKKSQNLPPSFASVESFTMIVKQYADSIMAVSQMACSGQNVTFPPSTYRFDGSEVFREDTVRGSKRWITTMWSKNGKKLTIVNRVGLRSNGKERKYTQTDVWQIKGKDILEIEMTQNFADTDSTHIQRRVYNRVK